jgi:hypothetical protein
VTEEVMGVGAKSAKDESVAGASENGRGGPDFRFLVGVAPELVEALGSFR